MIRSLARNPCASTPSPLRFQARRAMTSGGQPQVRQKHTLPTLDYPVEKGVGDFLSPRQLDFHYNKHHQTYVDKLNTLLQGTVFEGQPLDKVIQRTAFNAEHQAIFNNASQHWNHSFFWRCIRPQGTKAIPEPIAEAIKIKYKSIENFQHEFAQKAVNNFGSGWTWLVWNGEDLDIWNTSNAMTPIAENLVPLLTCDVWEHSYYLDYQNRRNEYLAKFWNAVNWDFVNHNFQILFQKE